MIDHERRELSWLLRTRVLTDSEMRRVQDLGYHICIGVHESYRAEQKIAEFNAALLQQYQIRDIAHRGQAEQVVLLRKALRFALDNGLFMQPVEIPAELRDLFASIAKEPA